MVAAGLAALLLAYSNGANDMLKGVATLIGSGTADLRRALGWAIATTLAGSTASIVLATGLAETFSGRGLVADAVASDPAFLLAVSLGAALTVLLATRFGLPVSTTHALAGSLVGAGLMATGGQIRWSSLAGSFVVPLVASPCLAISLTLALYPAILAIRRGLGVSGTDCVCIGPGTDTTIGASGGAAVIARTGAVIETGHIDECSERLGGGMVGLRASAAVNALHYLSGGAVSFARGLNDTPKMAAILLASRALAPEGGFALVAASMAVGGLLNARRVGVTMATKITGMSPGQGLTANVVTAFLVILASRMGLPVSTTHVSVGALFGIGLLTRTARPGVIASILAAWVTTLPLGMACAAAAHGILRHIL